MDHGVLYSTVLAVYCTLYCTLYSLCIVHCTYCVLYTVLNNSDHQFQSQFSVLYNEAMQLKTQLEENRAQLQVSKNAHMRQVLCCTVLLFTAVLF